jgi:hypothetical protein
MENTNQQQTTNRGGNLNPMYGKKQSYETKKKISDSQKERYRRIRHALTEQELLSNAQDDFETRKEVLQHLLDHNKLSFRSVQQAVNFLSIMLGKERIQSIIRAEIDKLLADNCKDSKG